MSKPFMATGLGKFLSGKGFSTILNTIGTLVPGAKLLADVKDLVIKSPEYKALPEEDQKEFDNLYYLQLRELDMILEDRADARNREVEITKTTGKRDITLMILSFIGVGAPILIVGYLVMHGIADMKPDVAMLVGGLIGIIVGEYKTVFGYYLGSSKGSQDKTDLLKQQQ